MVNADDKKHTFFLELYRKASSLHKNELYEYFLDHAVKVTKSKIGFFHFVCDDEKTIILTAWNKQALKNCKANYATHYPIEKAGNWADCVRIKRPIIYNDFVKSPNQKGLPDGHVQISRMLSFPLIEHGKVAGIFGVGNKEALYTQDDVLELELVSNELNKIIKQRRTEAEVLESKKKYQSLFENMLDGFAFCRMIFDENDKPVDFEYLEINDAFERLTGLKREDVIGKRVTVAIPETEKANPELFDIYGRVAVTCKPEKFEIYFKPLSRWFSISVYCPQKGYFAAVFENITERKKTEEALREKENRLNRSQEIAHLGSWELDLVKNKLTWSDEVYRIFGLKPQEFGANYEAFLEAVYPEDRKKVDDAYSGSLREGRDTYEVEHRVVRKDTGEVRFVHEKCEHIRDSSGQIVRSVGMVQDITEQKKADDALRESERRWSTTLSSIGDAVIATDVYGNVTFLNKVAEDLTGWTLRIAEQRSLKEIFNIINEKTRRKVESPVVRVLKEGMVIGLANHTILVRKDGSEVPIDDSGAPIKDEEGNITGIVLVFRDITERKKSEDATHESETKFRTVADFTYDWEYWIAPDGSFVYVSPSCERITSYKAEEFLKDPGLLKRIVHPEDEFLVDSHFDLISSDELHDVDFRIITRDGEARWISHACKAVFDDEGKWMGRRASNRDITDRKQMQAKLEEYSKHLEDLVKERTKQLKDSERLAAIGATAGMVGHDIRNPLQAIIGDVYLVKTELGSIPESSEKNNALECIEEIEKNVDYINKIVADLQDFARPLKPNAEETDIKLIIDQLLKKNGLPENIKITVKLESDAKKVVADSTFINRILYNLVNNAVQAMPKGGKLTICAYKEAKDTLIIVKDTGVGIPEDVKSKLFTPMFTTKSKGQGFGLAVIKRMTEALGGSVTFESQENKGTTFIIRLPQNNKQ